MKRYVVFIDSDETSAIHFIREAQCADIIIRKHTNETEIDFHCSDSSVVSLLSDRFALKRICELDEESDSYRPEKRQEYLDSESKIIKEANSLISQERYWESHTVLENLWKSYEGEMKNYYQGIILLSASMTQFQMDKLVAAMRLYKRARILLESTSKGKDILLQIPEKFTYPVFFII